MKNIKILSLFIVLALSSCSKKESEARPQELQIPEIVITDLLAGKESAGAPTAPEPGAEVLYFSLSEGKVSDIRNWDIAFTGIYYTQIISNTKANTWFSVLNTDYAKMRQAPSVAYQTAQSGNAGMSAEGWYSYDIQTHVLTTVPGKTICIKTGSGKIYKLEMKSIYKGAPLYPAVGDRAPYLNFRYQQLK